MKEPLFLIAAYLISCGISYWRGRADQKHFSKQDNFLR